MLPGCSDQHPLQTGVLPILTNRSCLKTDLPNISVRLNKTDGTREACLHMSWRCAKRVCFICKDVPAKPSVFYRTSICVVAVVVTPSLPECLWVDTNSTRTQRQPSCFFSCPGPKADVSIPLGFFITCSFYKIALASLPTLTSGEWKEKLPTCSICRWDNGDNNTILMPNPRW